MPGIGVCGQLVPGDIRVGVVFAVIVDVVGPYCQASQQSGSPVIGEAIVFIERMLGKAANLLQKLRQGQIWQIPEQQYGYRLLRPEI